MTESQLLLWDDNPSEVDLLGFDAIAAPIREALLRDRLDPVCAGIFGRWGSGKTTVLQLILHELDDDEAIVPVWTQPWAYDPATDVKATLIGEVLTAVRRHLDATGGISEDIRSKLRDLAKRVRWSKAIKLAARTAVTAQLPDLQDLEGLFGKDADVSEPTLEGFRDEFASLLEDGRIRRVVVVVDDLDRCFPETVIDTLEAIKLFLSVPKMAFLVAADEGPVRHAIATRYGESEEARSLADRYLDKIVQIPVDVPALGRGEVEAYLAQLLLQHALDGTGSYELVTEHCAGRRRAGEPNLLEALDVGQDVSDQLALAERLAPILYEELEGNPRQLKRFLNAYWIRSQIAAARGVAFEPSVVAKLMVLERLYPDDFRTVLAWLAEDRLTANLAQLEAGEGSGSAGLSRWGELEPQLSDRAADVSRYLVLAAALAGTTINVGSLPAHLRDLAARLASPRDADRAAARRNLDVKTPADRGLLARHIADLIRLQPSRSADLAESLVTVIGGDPEAEASALPALRRIRPAELAPALIVTLVPPGQTPSAAITQLFRTWGASEETAEDVRNAVDLIFSQATP